MSETHAEATTAEPTDAQPTADPKPTETVEFWKQKAREQESRAKANKTAADELAAVRDSQKTEAEKTAERISKAESEAASVPAKVADALKAYLVGLHEIPAEDAELFLTATNPELLLKQVGRLTARATDNKKQGNHVPREGKTSTATADPARKLANDLFNGS